MLKKKSTVSSTVELHLCLLELSLSNVVDSTISKIRVIRQCPSAPTNRITTAAKGERIGPVVEKTALNVADIYRSAGWGGSEMWPRLPDRLNVLFIVRFPSEILRRP